MSVLEALERIDRLLRDKYDPLGFIEFENGAYQTGHTPHVGPFAYLCWRYAGLDEEGLAHADAEAERYIPEPYRELLGHMNGARLLGVSLHGSIGGSVDRSGVGIGQAVSIRYQNVIERPTYIPAGHLGIGAINGEWMSQGHLYLASTGEVELYHRDLDLVGAKWPSLEDFLGDEISRRTTLYDAQGRELDKSKRLPGDTGDWERLAEEAKRKAKGNGFWSRILDPFRRK